MAVVNPKPVQFGAVKGDQKKNIETSNRFSSFMFFVVKIVFFAVFASVRFGRAFPPFKVGWNDGTEGCFGAPKEKKKEIGIKPKKKEIGIKPKLGSRS